MPREGLHLRITGADELERSLLTIGVRMSDLDFRAIADEGVRLAARFAPRRSGRLARSIKASASQSKAVIRAGSAAAPYAGPINYGWQSRRIPPAHFMQKADLVLRRTVPPRLERQIQRIIRRQGMS